MCSCDSSDGPSAFYSKQRKARKEHQCFECCKKIPVGAVYEYASGIWDGEASSFKTCLRCVGLREAHIKAEEMVQRDERTGYRANWPIERCNVAFGTVIESIRECVREDGYLKHFRAARASLSEAGR